MCDAITPPLLAAQSPSPLDNALASQLLLCCVLRPVVQLATPDHLNPLCVAAISAALRANPTLSGANGGRKAAAQVPSETTPGEGEPPPWLQRAARTALREQELAAADALRAGGAADAETPPPPMQAVLFANPSAFHTAAADDAQRTPQRMRSRARSAFQDASPAKRGRSVGGTSGKPEVAGRVPSGLSRVSSSYTRGLGPAVSPVGEAERIRGHGGAPALADVAPPAASDPGGGIAAAQAPGALVGAPYGLPSIATSAVASSIRASDSVLTSVHRSARMASSALYGMLGKGGADGRHRDGTASVPTTPPRTAGHGADSRLARVSSSAAASGTHTGASESDSGGDSDSDGGEWGELWGGPPGSPVAAQAGQVRVRGELTGEVVYLSAEHFDAMYVGDVEGGGVGDGERSVEGTRARLRKSLRLRRSLVPAWDVLVTQAAFDAVRARPRKPLACPCTCVVPSALRHKAPLACTTSSCVRVCRRTAGGQACALGTCSGGSRTFCTCSVSSSAAAAAPRPPPRAGRASTSRPKTSQRSCRRALDASASTHLPGHCRTNHTPDVKLRCVVCTRKLLAEGLLD